MSQNSDSLLSALRTARSDQVEARVRAVLLRMEAEGAAPSFYVVAKEARVARSTLYRRPELRQLVERARDAARQAPASPTDQQGLLRENARLRVSLEKLRRECTALRQSEQASSEKARLPWLVYGVCLLGEAA